MELFAIFGRIDISSLHTMCMYYGRFKLFVCGYVNQSEKKFKVAYHLNKNINKY